jgi:hypothetical protein
MADVVSILISLAPFILDLLFGGECMKHQKINPRDNKMDSALLMSGHGYPRRKDYTDEKEFNKAYAKEYAKYAVRAAKNPWVLFLEKSGFYERMKQELDQLRDIYDNMKEDAGFVQLARKDTINPKVIKALSKKKSKQLDKFKAARDILEQIGSPNPNPIQEEFMKIIEKEYDKIAKMGFAKEDIEDVLTRALSKLFRATESAEKRSQKVRS